MRFVGAVAISDRLNNWFLTPFPRRVGESTPPQVPERRGVLNIDRTITVEVDQAGVLTASQLVSCLAKDLGTGIAAIQCIIQPARFVGSWWTWH